MPGGFHNSVVGAPNIFHIWLITKIIMLYIFMVYSSESHFYWFIATMKNLDLIHT